MVKKTSAPEVYSIQSFGYTRAELSRLVGVLEKFQLHSGGDDDDDMAVSDRLIEDLKSQLKGIPRK